MVSIPTQFGQAFRVFPAAARGPAPSIGIGEWLSSFFRPSTVGGLTLNKALGRISVAKFPTKISTGTKVFGTTVAGATAIGFVTQTPGGQNLVTQTAQTAKDVTNVSLGITRFFSQNPLLLVGLIALGIIIVVKK